MQPHPTGRRWVWDLRTCRRTCPSFCTRRETATSLCKELREAGVGKLYVEERLKLAKLGDAYVQ